MILLQLKKEITGALSEYAAINKMKRTDARTKTCVSLNIDRKDDKSCYRRKRWVFANQIYDPD